MAKINRKANLNNMQPSDMLKMYGQLLLSAQRMSLRKRDERATELCHEAEEILMHFEKNLD